MRHLLVVAALTASVGLTAAEAFADDIVIFGSGVDAAGKVLAPGAADPHYVVTRVPAASAFKVPAPAVVALQNPAYFKNDAVGSLGTSWIGIGSNLSNIFVPGDYVFRTTFDLTGLDPATAQITVETATDDMIGTLDLNGASTGIVQFGFKGFSAPATITAGFRPGVNTLDFLVKNLGGTATSMGLRVRIKGTADRLDNDAPEFVGVADHTFDFTGSNLALTPAFLGITAEDDYDGEVPVTLSPTSVGLGTHTITATASDAAGNTATVSFVVAVVDADPPTLLGVANHSFDFTGSNLALTPVLLGITAEDEIDGALPVTLSPASVGLGTHTITATASDASGNTATASFVVAVVDADPPEFLGVADHTFDFAGEAIELSAGALGIHAVDAIDGPVSVSLMPNAVGLGTHTIVATATDASGNVASTAFTVTVQDVDPPVLSGVADQTFEYAGSPIALNAATLGITATDVADGALAVTLTPSSVGLGTHTVTAIASDAAGNSVSKSFRVKVADTTAPALSALRATPDALDARDKDVVLVRILANILDAGDAAPRMRITGVTSNDRKATGSGRKPDWKVTGDLTVELRAEGWDAKTPRTYTIAVECVDASGNRTTGTVTVPVVKDRGRDRDGRCDGRDDRDDRKDDPWDKWCGRDDDRDGSKWSWSCFR